MSNFPKNPQPHIQTEKETIVPQISSSERKRIIHEMTELIRENKRIVAKHTSKNEIAYE
jgi:hypothetical protein